ncbi:MAG: NAD-dependent malic enzyme [Deltaproteobacteria bacterium]|nr:NAD-dependent malic enzyme [Deltaproteobacteria bacterium]
MAYKRRVIRTLRVRNQQQVGALSKVIQAIASGGGDIGDIKTHSLGTFHTVRDISMECEDEEQLETILQAVRAIKTTRLEAVVDDVMELHKGGKLLVVPKHPVKSVEDLRKVYTPGVAAVSMHLQSHPEEACEYTGIARTVALVTNGTRVLGLGNIGPIAAMPVMEGKAALFSQFSGYNMIPILLKTEDPDEFVKNVIAISPAFGAIQLEDIQTPDCFQIEERLIQKLEIPVMHDDQHGTGAAGSSIARLVMSYTGKNVTGTDVQPYAIKRMKKMGGAIVASIAEVMKRSDIVIATTGHAGLIKPEMVRKGQIILALSNPDPEISIKEAVAAGAGFASDGRYVNNLLGYPGILRGAIEGGAKRITAEMYLAAVEAIVRQTAKGELVPDPLNPALHEAVAAAVRKAVR